MLRGEITLRTFRLLVQHMRPGNSLDVARGVTLPDNHLLLNVESRLRDLYAQQVNMWRDKNTPEYTPPYLISADDDELELIEALDADVMADLDDIWHPQDNN